MRKAFEYETLHCDDFKQLRDRKGNPVFALDAVPFIVVDLAAVEARECALLVERIQRQRDYENSIHRSCFS